MKSMKSPSLSVFFNWCLVGKIGVSDQVQRTITIDEWMRRLSQILMFECLSLRQAKYCGGDIIKRTRELPLQVGLGLNNAQGNALWKTLNLLYKLGVSVTYDRVLDIKSEMATTVVQKMAVSGGVQVPPELKLKKFLISQQITQTFVRIHLMKDEHNTCNRSGGISVI